VPEGNDLTESRLGQLHEALERVPFAKLLGLKLVAAFEGSVTVQLKIRSELKQIQGVVHGGVTASLIDTATALAIATVLGTPEKVLTVDLTIHYLRPLIEGTATVEARIVRAGRRLFTLSADVRDDGGKLAATAVSTYIMVS
jgi:uncharacterized protein (TIGR00369 family)